MSPHSAGKHTAHVCKDRSCLHLRSARPREVQLHLRVLTGCASEETQLASPKHALLQLGEIHGRVGLLLKLHFCSLEFLCPRAFPYSQVSISHCPNRFV